MTDEQHIGEPAPECQALRCQKCGRLRHAECHTIGEHDEDGVLIDGHDFKPGRCDCELGRLRADLETREEKVRYYAEELGGANKEIERLREAIRKVSNRLAGDRIYSGIQAIEDLRDALKEEGDE